MSVKEIRYLQDVIIPKLHKHLDDAQGFFKRKERRELEEWKQLVHKSREPQATERIKMPERENVRERLRQIQVEGKQKNQTRQKRKSYDRDCR